MAYKEIGNELANFWLPKKANEQLEGTIKQIKDGRYGKFYIITLKDGEEIATPSHKVLQGRMQEVAEGDKVRITYLESLPPKVRGQNPTQMYKVEIDE